MKKGVWILACIMMICILGGVLFAACNDNSESDIFLKQDKNSVIIGVNGVQEWKFVKDGENWKFDGVYVKGVRAFEVPDGDIFRFSRLAYNTEHPETVIDSSVKEVTVNADTDENKSIKITNGQATMFLSVEKGSKFVKRDIVIDLNCDNVIAEYQIGFTLRTVEDVFTRKDGAIATKNNSVASAEIPYANPAIYAQFYGDNFTVDAVNIVDYNSTDFAVNYFRLRQVSDVFELGACSGSKTFSSGETVQLHDYWYFEGQTNNDIYDVIGIMSKQTSLVTPMSFENLAHQGNLNAETFEELSRGLYRDLQDDRCFINGAYIPYGYSTGWSESFASFDVLKGVVRYAKQIKNDEMYNKAMAMVKYILCDSSWVTQYDGANAKAGEYFLYQSYDGKYSANSSGEETGTTPGISTWKYYDMMANIGEIALFTQDQDVINGFIRLMPFFNTLVLDNYNQPVAWFYSTRKPATGSEDGGSGGAAAIWGYVHLMASQLTDNQAQKTKWQQDGLASLEHANSLSFFKMHSIRIAVKSVSIGWAVRGNIYAYNITNDTKYLDSAKHIAQGLMTFYYINNNPYTFFTSYGYSYACTRERWEAYFETANALWLITDVMDYLADDNAILDMYYASSRSHQWFFPINATPYGNYTGPLDSIDGHYIPFEFGTGVLGDDPGNEGGSQALLRQTKEIYGCGETFLEYLMFEAYGKAVDSRLLTLCTTGALANYSDTKQNFVLYNPFQTSVTSAVVFRGFADGKYTVTVDGKDKGVYSSWQLNNGISFTVEGRQSLQITVKRIGDATNDSTSNQTVNVSVSNVTNSSARLTATDGYSHYIFYVSEYDGFDYATRVIRSSSNVCDIYFADNSKLYVKAVGVTPDGIASANGNVETVLGKDVEVLAVDDFSQGGSLKNWTVANGEGKSDFYSGQFYTSSDLLDTTLTASRTMSVDASAKIFEIRFVTKNANSTVDVILSCGSKNVVAFAGIGVLEKGVLQYDLATSGLFDGLNGEQQVTVTIRSTGKSRGFAVSYLRFISMTNHTDTKAFLDNDFTSTYAKATVQNGALVIKNDATPTVVNDPSIDVLFDPKAMPIWEVEFDGYRAIDTVHFTITDENKQVVADTGTINITANNGRLSYNLTEDFNITTEGVYTFAYTVSNDRVEISKMQLVGENSDKTAFTKANGVVDGNSAYIDDNGYIKLKYGTIYNYGEASLTLPVDMDNSPIVFFDIAALKGNWSAKIVAEGTVGDIAITPDNSRMGKIAIDLRKYISNTGTLNITFKIFVIGSGAGDQDCYVKVDSIGFGNSITLVTEKTDQVVSAVEYSLGNVNLQNSHYLSIDVQSIDKGASWKVYVIDNDTGRAVELRNVIERKYSEKYNRAKVGQYIFDITEITGLTGSKNLSIRISIIGNNASAVINNVKVSNVNTLGYNY